MRHAYRCHVSPNFLGADRAAPERNGERCRLDPELMDTARCPCCRAPLIARMGRTGPYFHCLCRENELRVAAKKKIVEELPRPCSLKG